MVLVATIFIVMISTPLFAVDAVAPGSTWYVRGYVKNSTTLSAIANAKVQVFNDFVYLGYVYTSTSGYFSFSTTRRPTNYECGWQVVVTKTGYLDAIRYATPVDYVTNMGTILMTVVPPPPPPDPAVISNVDVTIGGSVGITISWDVDWDDTSTGYLSQCWWSEDAIMDTEDLFFSTTDKQASYSVSLPKDKIPFMGGEFHYQILARNSKNGCYPVTYYGPATIVVDEVWTIEPTDDAFTASYGDYEPDENYNTELLHVSSGDSKSWLKFNIANPCIEKAVLYIYYNMNINNGGGTIYAHSSSCSWNEESITQSNEPDMGILLDTEIMHTPQPSAGAYQMWDVTAAQGTDGSISITLCCSDGDSIFLYSKESSSLFRPYLEITYRGMPESPVPDSEESIGVDFIDDEFAYRAPDVHDWTTDIWTLEEVNDPQTPLDQCSAFLRTNPDLPIDGALHYQYQTTLAQPDWTGHILKQDDLYIEGAFCFVAEVHIGVCSLWPEQKIGLELFTSGITTPIASMWDIRHPYYWQPQADQTYQEIYGYAKAGSTTDTGNYFDIHGAQTYILIIQRDISGTLKVGYADDSSDSMQYLNPQNTLAEIQNSQPIVGVHLSMLYRAANNNLGYSVDMECGYVRECTMLTIANPHDNLDPFETPIHESDFDISGDLTFWKDYDGSDPMDHGYIFPEPDNYNDKVWRAPASMVQSKHWYLKQSLGTVPNDFTLSAVEGQNIAFTYLARRDSSDVIVRGVIIYKATGQTSYVVVGGDWISLPDDGNWHSVNVKTQFSLPSSLEYLEVIMEGVSTNDQSFSAFVDIAKLSCFRNTEMEDIIRGDCVISFSLGLIKAECEYSQFELSLMPSVVIRTGQTCHINSVNFIVEVSSGEAKIEENGIIEGNDKQIDIPDGVRHTIDKEYVACQSGIVRWGTRLFTTGLGIGLKALGMTQPYLFIVTGLAAEVIGNYYEYQIQSYEKYAIEENRIAAANDPINIQIDYANEPNLITSSLELEWKISNPSDYPVATFTIMIEWVDFLGNVVTTSHTILASFDYIMP